MAQSPRSFKNLFFCVRPAIVVRRIGRSAGARREKFEIDSDLFFLSFPSGYIFKPVFSLRPVIGSFLKIFYFVFFCFQLTAHVLGNKAEMDITQYIEQNPTLMRVGLFFEFNDARSRVATQLQKNIDRSKILFLFVFLPFNSLFFFYLFLALALVFYLPRLPSSLSVMNLSPPAAC